MRRLGFILLSIMLMGSASAHQLKTAITTVLFNERSGNIEVMHRFYLHDAEHAIKHLVDKNADLHSKEETRAQFARYAVGHFELQTMKGDELPLTVVGYQVDGPHFWVYQETPLRDGLSGLRMQQSALQDLWVDQENIVNVERRIEGNLDVRTVTFTRQDDWLDVSLSD